MKNLFLNLQVIIGITLLFGFILLFISNKRQNKSINKHIKALENQFNENLEKYNGQNFFCYNERKQQHLFIENEILPDLAPNISIIYLDKNKQIHSTKNQNLASNLLFHLKNYTKFPHLLKIREGKIIDKSINNMFFSVVNQTLDKKVLFNEINDFYNDK
ncbi:hypothetical protein QJU23_07730 [Pasteurella atlantica]|uniref:Uncharacterized protein n=2 Tax=Pasteurellaceae TaxID=712 RepID=A0ACC6HNE5_9PAST|nr:hypothetical protein [Pasteurella atlantica]MDP8052309.1 hypothetical protein [Pasteurella atlantica]MDP8105138.1 hypothetical protein [Pasteurella atlantica]MDP8148623.1 hypothetical protein [Pasteurella atlantica]